MLGEEVAAEEEVVVAEEEGEASPVSWVGAAYLCRRQCHRHRRRLHNPRRGLQTRSLQLLSAHICATAVSLKIPLHLLNVYCGFSGIRELKDWLESAVPIGLL